MSLKPSAGGAALSQAGPARLRSLANLVSRSRVHSAKVTLAPGYIFDYLIIISLGVPLATLARAGLERA